MKTIIISFFVLMSISLLSCKKEDPSINIPDQEKMWDCHHQNDWNSSKIINAFSGKWKWVFTQNYWQPITGRNTENENIEIEFVNDSVLNIIQNGIISISTKWEIVPVDGDLFGLSSDSSISFLYGRILICGNTLEFNNTYLDGDDNYFLRTE
jgi:hypothetical protein